jgi:hypothetical protein
MKFGSVSGDPGLRAPVPLISYAGYGEKGRVCYAEELGSSPPCLGL